MSIQPIPISGIISDQNGFITKPWVQYFRSLENVIPSGTYVIANAAIPSGAHIGISYDEKGLVTGFFNVTTTDIPEGNNLYYTNQRVIDYLSSKDGILQGINGDVSSVTVGVGLDYTSGTLSANAVGQSIGIVLYSQHIGLS